MKVVTWNMGYWLHRGRHSEAWTYLRERLKPDLALLQETLQPQAHRGEYIDFHETHQGWGTAIYSPAWSLEATEYKGEYPGRVATAVASIPGAGRVFLASIHAPIIGNRVFPHLSKIIDEVEELSAGSVAILGGDFNSARLAEDVWPGNGHGPFFDHMDASRYVNCCWRLHGRELQTYFRPGSKHPFQDDHLFITKDLLSRLVACEVVDNPVTRSVSDHIPLAIEITLQN